MKKKPAPVPSTEGVPRAVDAERLVLREVLLYGPDDLAVARRILTARDFFDPRHALVFAALCELQDSGAPIEILALRCHLEERGKLLEVGGPAFLGSLVE